VYIYLFISIYQPAHIVQYICSARDCVATKKPEKSSERVNWAGGMASQAKPSTVVGLYLRHQEILNALLENSKL